MLLMTAVMLPISLYSTLQPWCCSFGRIWCHPSGQPWCCHYGQASCLPSGEIWCCLFGKDWCLTSGIASHILNILLGRFYSLRFPLGLESLALEPVLGCSAHVYSLEHGMALEPVSDYSGLGHCLLDPLQGHVVPHSYYLLHTFLQSPSLLQLSVLQLLHHHLLWSEPHQ